ncbi:condensin complex subunit 2 [Benincasa hispida]|uniref:condensin complex subunit 2 n=1 Tax=Benincasa hispida TaxID=102211 RepID=UPI0018FF1237|nr:condensin complex subunit 2 [Benincasa hispida]
MAETLSPNPSIAQKQRRPMASQLQSPTSPFFLGSNDDQLERAQARAARAAASRRKSIATNLLPREDPNIFLDKRQILELFQNCIKLASENKINQKNTWELNLIDHLAEIIKVEEEDTETNFQKASCTLEAGVKIYSLRVDATHSEAYKVLGGMNRAGQENEQETIMQEGNPESEQEGVRSKKEEDKKLSPLSTLESSFEALNVKKFDVAFAVDPLYHQTSAQFDEGGAKGLLMNNLGVYGACRVLFDSDEVPGKCMSFENRHDSSDMIDISFAKDCIEEMVLNMRVKDEISPTLRNIVNLFDEDNIRPSDYCSSGLKAAEQVHTDYDVDDRFDGDDFDNFGTANYDNDDQASTVDDGLGGGDASFPTYHEESVSNTYHDPDVEDRLGNVDEYLISCLGFAVRQNAWAGPEHWKYRKTKVSRDSPTENGSETISKRARSKKQVENDIDFTNNLEKEGSDLFAPPRNPKSLLLPKNRAPCNTKLPEDCHYQPEDLVKLFLLPNVKCLRRKGKQHSDEPVQHNDDYGTLPSWEDDNGFGGQFDEGDGHSDVEDSDELVTKPRQVNKIEVQYDKKSKQVDVQALKETLWSHLQESRTDAQGEDETVSFKQIIATFPDDCRAAQTINDISPHLCFICLLHLANEHGLRIIGSDHLNDLTIHFGRHN